MDANLTIAQLARKYGLEPLKKYGQNFLFDSSLCEKIVRFSKLLPNSEVLEIGPGTGGLTKAILNLRPRRLTVIETDKRCIPLLEEIKQTNSVLEIIKADALEFSVDLLNNTNINIISNLPYNIGTELLIKWLKQINLIESITIMLQKEVVDRIKAKPGNKAYGRLSVICNTICNIEKGFDVSPVAFYPPPKVTSSLVRLTPKENIPSLEIINILELITQKAFGQRRKMLKSSLNDLQHLFPILNIDPTARAENISADIFLALANLYYNQAAQVHTNFKI